MIDLYHIIYKDIIPTGMFYYLQTIDSQRDVCLFGILYRMGGFLYMKIIILK
jgi:hypothetical protein